MRTSSSSLMILHQNKINWILNQAWLNLKLGSCLKSHVIDSNNLLQVACDIFFYFSRIDFFTLLGNPLYPLFSRKLRNPPSKNVLFFFFLVKDNSHNYIKIYKRNLQWCFTSIPNIGQNNKSEVTNKTLRP